MARVFGTLHSVEKRVHDGLVPAQRENQGDVDTDAFRQAGSDSRETLPGRGNLDEQVGPVDQPPQCSRLGNRGVRIAGEPRVDLYRNPAVDAIRRVIDRPEHITGPADVGRGEGAQSLADPDATRGQVPYLWLVDVTAGDGFGEDRWISRHSDDVLMGGQVGQAAGFQPLAAQVIQPDRDARLAQCCQWVSHREAPSLVAIRGVVAGRYCTPARPRNSARERASDRNVPSRVEVMVVEPSARIPRSVMQECSASSTTPAPRGRSREDKQSAICLVSRSCVCGLAAKWATSRASLDSPRMRSPGK